MLLSDKKIAIIGGGPGGLTLARLLLLKDLGVQVYERDKGRGVRTQGATLDLHMESGLAALEQGGLTKAFYRSYRPDAGKLRITDHLGNIRVDDHSSDGYSEDRPEIDRGPLRELLLDSLHHDTLVWDSHFTHMERYGAGWHLYFKNKGPVYADLVIGADGASSRIRPYLSDITPVYSGITIVEGNLYDSARYAPNLHEMVKGGKLFAFGEESSLILSSKGDGSLSFYTGCKVDEHWSDTVGIDFNKKSEVHAWFNDVFGTWSPLWQELFNGEETWFIPRPQYHFPIDQFWEPQQNLTMIGDAAHRMPPYAGEGVNMAMLDALELSRQLTESEEGKIAQAIQRFERSMRTRSSKVTQFTLEATQMLHSTDPINRMLKMMEGGDSK